MNGHAALPLALPAHTRQIAALLQNWVLPVAAVLLATLAAVAVGRTVALVKNGAGQNPRQTLRHVLHVTLQALAYMAVLAGAMLAGHALELGGGAEITLRLGFAVALLWAGFVVLDAFERHLYAAFLRQGRHAAVTVIPLLDKVAKGTWALLIVLVSLENMGFNVKTLLAGLGVGGLAVALAGQKTIENLFGGLMLVLDQPVRAGDFCGFGSQSGEVLEVGLRSIKLRTADRTVITVPNGEFSQLTLENFSRRDRIRFDMTLGLRLDTGAQRLSRVVATLEAVLKADAKVDHAMDHYARFVKLSAFSLDVEVFCYHSGSDWGAFMLWRQSLMLVMLEALEGAGARLAFPTQITLSEETPTPH
ncbi:MAG: mechanosensitive ion channel family protein [bacterium]